MELIKFLHQKIYEHHDKIKKTTKYANQFKILGLKKELSVYSKIITEHKKNIFKCKYTNFSTKLLYELQENFGLNIDGFRFKYTIEQGHTTEFNGKVYQTNNPEGIKNLENAVNCAK